LTSGDQGVPLDDAGDDIDDSPNDGAPDLGADEIGGT
jgi:hypothetical protein